MPSRIVPFYTVVNEYNQAGEDSLVAGLAGHGNGALVIFNTTIGKTRIWNGTVFVNAPVLNPDGSAWGGGYCINVQALTSSPVDGQTIYFGTLPKAPVTTAGQSKIYIRKAGVIKVCEIYCFSGTAGSNEAWSLSIRKNNSADTLVATVSASTTERVFSKSDLSISAAAGDYIEIKMVNPTWGTNPLTTILGGYIYIE